VLASDIEGPEFKQEHCTPEFQFDLYLSQQSLGQASGRPCIYLQSNDEYIGYCLLMQRWCAPDDLALIDAAGQDKTHFASIEAVVGWAISERHRGKGYATEAAMALIEYGFSVLHLPRIIAFTEPCNLPSMRVMEKLGMKLTTDSSTRMVAGCLINDRSK
jgi:RimJ/RimL family protein N-acetyltransferase